MGQQSDSNTMEVLFKESRILFNFLRISPSYTAATQFAPSISGKIKTPSESKQVLKTYKKYGDVQQTLFDDWIKAKGSKSVQIKDTNFYIVSGASINESNQSDLFLKVSHGGKVLPLHEVITVLKKIWPKQTIHQFTQAPLGHHQTKILWKSLNLF